MFNWYFEWKRRKEARNLKQLAITDEMRQKSLEVRRLQAQVATFEKQVGLKRKLDILEEALGVSKSDSWEEKIGMAILNKFINPQNPLAGQTEGLVHGETESTKDLSDLEIETFINQNPHLVDYVRKMKMSHEQLVFEVKEKVPNLSDKTHIRIADILLKRAEGQ